MNLLFAIDRKNIYLLFTCVFSILKNGNYDKYTIYVFHSDLCKDNIDEIIKFYNEIEWHFILLNKEMFSSFPTFKRYPEQIYYRLAAPLLLPKDLDRILYLDVDTIVIHSLKEIYEIDFENNLFVATTNTKDFLTKINQLRLGISIRDEIPYVNTGVLLMNLKKLRNELSMNDIRKFMESKKNILFLPDQDILTGLYGHKVKIVDNLRFNLSDRAIRLHNLRSKNEEININWVKENTNIIHFYGTNKPWNEDYKGELGEFYYKIVEELYLRIQKYNIEKNLVGGQYERI